MIAFKTWTEEGGPDEPDHSHTSTSELIKPLKNQILKTRLFGGLCSIFAAVSFGAVVSGLKSPNYDPNNIEHKAIIGGVGFFSLVAMGAAFSGVRRSKELSSILKTVEELDIRP